MYLSRIVLRMSIEEGPDGAADRLSRLLSTIAEKRDQAAFREMFDALAPRIRAFIGRRGADPQSVEEVLQETFVTIWKKAHMFDPTRASASTWIYTIARNARIDLLRKEGRPGFDPNDPALVNEAEPSAFQAVARTEDATRIRNACATLSPEQREVIHLAFFEDRTHGEIAQVLDLPLGTVKSRIRLAMNHIRAALGEDTE